MAASFDKVLEDARTLSWEDQRKLIQVLSSPRPFKLQLNADGSIRTVYDALLEHGLIGCIEDGPSDLSTNPKYMEGFGEHE